MSKQRFLVIVMAPPPPRLDGATYSMSTQQRGPRLVWVDAESKAFAAKLADVKPGGSCIVVSEAEAERFYRPEVAELVKRSS